MPGPNIDAEEISFKKAMLMEEAELNDMRRNNIARYESLLKELEAKEAVYIVRLNNIQDEIDAHFKEREDHLEKRDVLIKEMEASVHLRHEEVKQLLKDAQDERAYAHQKNVQAEALTVELDNKIKIFSIQAEALEKTKDQYQKMVDELSASLSTAEEMKVRAQKDINDAQDKLLYSKGRYEAADRLYQENQRESQRLALLIEEANKKIQKAEDAIKKMGPRWITREA